MSSYTSLLSFLDNGYTFLFFSTTSFFISIAWSYNFLLVSSHLFSFQRHEFICGTFEKPIFWPFLQILWCSSYYPKSSILLLSFLLLLFFLFLFFFFFFSSSFFCSYFSYFFPFFPFFSSSFCFCYSNFLYFSLYYLLYFSEHLVIFTSPALQSISGL